MRLCGHGLRCLQEAARCLQGAIRWLQGGRISDTAVRQAVADHYVAKGYRIRERVRVRGKSGTVHMAEMVAQGPLGAMLIAFEDEGGFEGPELSAIKNAARDIGAQAVAAAQRFPDGLRRRAAELGVVLLDEASLTTPEPVMPEPEMEVAYPPWPSLDQDAPDPEDTPWPGTPRAGRMVAREIDDVVAELQTPATRTKSTDPGFWNYPRDGVQRPPRPKASFEWIPDEPEVHDERPATVEERVEQRAQQMQARAPAPVARPRSDVGKWVLVAVLFGATSGGVFYALSRILG